MSPRLPAELEEVLEACSRDERCTGALPFEERVRRHRGAVPETLHPMGTDRPCGSYDGFLLTTLGQHLRGRQTPVFEEYSVREGSTNIDAENRHGQDVVMHRAGIVLAALAFAGGTAVAAGPEWGVALIDAGTRTVRVEIEIADDVRERQRGLMGRRSLAPNAGMAFLYEVDTRTGFWMKDTLIPLSIAFVDRKGRIVSIRRMVPCEADPCPVYKPGVSYRSALEVNRGAFGRWGVGLGDVIRIRR
jgi:hypothetical protein